MIEQTDLVVTEWIYRQPTRLIGEYEHIPNTTSLEVQKKRKNEKKGIACRFSCQFTFENETILKYVGQDSYVIDLEDKIDKDELLKMIKNSYSKFQAAFELRKLATVLHREGLTLFDETKLDLNPVLLLLG